MESSCQSHITPRLAANKRSSNEKLKKKKSKEKSHAKLFRAHIKQGVASFEKRTIFFVGNKMLVNGALIECFKKDFIYIPA